MEVFFVSIRSENLSLMLCLDVPASLLARVNEAKV
jgi:hypothetical protein